MAPMSTQTGSSVNGRDRRVFERHQVKSLAYLDIGSDNGGIVLNISEGGVAVHAVSVLPPEPLVDLRLQLPRSSKRLETKGKVAWTSGTKKEAGVEFIDLPEEVRLEIREWLASENLEPVYMEGLQAGETGLPVRRPPRKDKWTSLVSELTSIPTGIDRAAEDRATSMRPVTIADALSVQETALPVSPETNAVTAGEEGATSAQTPDFGLTDSLVASQQEPDAESNSIAPSDLIDRALSGSPDLIGDLQYHKSDAELSLPSDKLLNSPLSISIVPSRSDKTDVAKGARKVREPASNDADGDDFVKKARALFGPKHPEKLLRKFDDSTPAPEPVRAAAAESLVENNRTEPETKQAPMSDLVATSTPSSAPFTPSALRPVTSIPIGQDASPGSEPKRRPQALPPTRGLDLRNFLSILALCVLLSTVCLVLGIFVGRSAATRSRNFADARYSGASQTALPDERNSAISNAAPAPSTSRAQDPTQSQIPAGRDQRPHAEATPHRKPSSRSTGNDSASSSDAASGSDQDSIHNQEAHGSAVISPAADTASAGVVIMPPAAALPTVTAPSSRVSPQPEASAAPRPQPPSDRMVAAYLIYRVEPIYPKSASQVGVEGTVKIHATVGHDGSVKNLKVVSGPSSLTSAAIDAAQYWRYIPALRNGEPIESEIDISIDFQRPR